MPFYRSVLQNAGGGGGGGGGSAYFPYFTFDSDVEDLDVPIMDSFYFNMYHNVNQEALSQINKITIGNKMTSIGSMCSNWQLYNSPIDLKNASILNNAEYLLSGCNVFNSPVTFPTQYSGFSEYGLGISYGSMFSECYNYNRPTTVRAYDLTTNANENTYINISSMFYNCSNLNSRVLFDFYKENTHYYDNYDYGMILYDCGNIFSGCRNFNQPLIFPYGCSSGFNNYIFNNCLSFNQPIVVDFFLCGSYGINCYGLFSYHPNMASDIIFLNAECLYVNSKYYFDGMLNNSRTKMTNIYIRNVPNIYNSNVVTTSNNIEWTITQSPYNSSCNVYTNSMYKITIREDIEEGLNIFNNYYYNFYGEYPVIPHIDINTSEDEDINNT